MDVAVIGDGLVDLTATTLPKPQGKTVAVLETGCIVHDVTGYTTAKGISQHNLIYDDLTRQFGEKKARAYAEANQSAIEQISDLVRVKQIDCDFSCTETYAYTEFDDEVNQIKAEAGAAPKLEFPVSFMNETLSPFPGKAAVRFDNQAQFHPHKYLLALARDIPGECSYIFEGTRAVNVEEGEPCVITTEPSHSMRSYPAPGSDLLLVGGGGHKTEQDGDTVACYQRLERLARERFAVPSMEYYWSTQDNRSIDGVPYIGRYGSTPGISISPSALADEA
ncbi:MAG: FAD-binding oxidoreductase [Gemmatimonadaceae bacterium]|nr:FAD-binding oxidoreductase [Gemmatimonadaceae bacterium]